MPEANRPDTKAILEDLRNNRGQTTWTLWTDGSGHADGYGGYAGIGLRIPDLTGKSARFTVSGALDGTTVNRAEFTGFLECLQKIDRHEALLSKAGITQYPALPVTVRWFSDRENLVLAVLRDRQSGEPVYSRRTDQDLWARYEWYEPRISVLPVHNKRNVLHFQAMCDKIASDGRRAYIKWLRRRRNRKEWI